MSSVSHTNSSTVAKEWDQLRTAFASSILVDTSLCSLAQNLDGPEWPLTGENETPAAYIDYQYEELVCELDQRGHPTAVPILMGILRETLAFDQPFGEMVKQTQAAAERENPLLRVLARLGIAESFPLELTVLDDSARHLCKLEQVWTLGELALFAQKLSQGVIVGGDLKHLLNALAHLDESTLAELLPFRRGTKGLHLAEALAQATRAANPAEHASRAVRWFATEFDEWQRMTATDRSFVRRQLAVLRDDAVERRAAALLGPHFRVAGTPTPAPKSSLATLTGWFRR